jgi:hypothetical protein
MSSNQQLLDVRPLLNMGMKDLCQLPRQEGDDEGKTLISICYMHASWTPSLSTRTKKTKPVHNILSHLLDNLKRNFTSTLPENAVFFTGSLQVDQSDECMAQCIGDEDDACIVPRDQHNELPCPPAMLPVLALSVQTPSHTQARVLYLTDIASSELVSCFQDPDKNAARMEHSWLPLLQTAISQLISGKNGSIFPPPRKQNHKRAFITTDNERGDSAIRIFIAGDRSSVGKSSVCLGLLGNLVNHFGYEPSSLAYIKPATQCEAPQLVQKYCDSVGIACVPVGPLVYYKGFTRAFLAGETGQTSEDLLRDCGEAVDNIAKGKQIVLVDGVGFPAVGSICGTDNASVSKACGYPQSISSTGEPRSPMGVVVVGGSGVGAAVDAFNLNATYFEKQQIPVMGGIFNKLSAEGFYSLDNCRTQLTRYFQQNEYQQRLKRTAFGFVPQFESLTGDDAMKHVEDFFQIFAGHVDIQAILDSAKRIKQETSAKATSATSMEIDSQPCAPPSKRVKVDATANKENGTSSNKATTRSKLARRDIELMAARQGAAPTA